MNQVYLKALRTDEKFHAFMVECAKEIRPIVPQYKAGRSIEETAALIEEIKFQSGQQQGFDRLLHFLTGSVEP